MLCGLIKVGKKFDFSKSIKRVAEYDTSGPHDFNAKR